MSDSSKYQVQVYTNEPEYIVYDFRGSKTPLFVYQDMQRSKPQDLKDAKVAIDLGANVGLWSFRMAKLYPQCKFIAYEPYSVNIKHFKMGLDDNHLDNVELIPFGASGNGRAVKLMMDPTNSGSASQFNTESVMFPHEVVQTVSLEGVVAPYNQVDFLKVDIEGGEFTLFNGFQSWDKLKKIFMEIHPVYLLGTDEEKCTQMKSLCDLLKSKIGQENVSVDCTDERFRNVF